MRWQFTCHPNDELRKLTERREIVAMELAARKLLAGRRAVLTATVPSLCGNSRRVAGLSMDDGFHP
jgi:hypothetical protein